MLDCWGQTTCETQNVYKEVVGKDFHKRGEKFPAQYYSYIYSKNVFFDFIKESVA